MGISKQQILLVGVNLLESLTKEDSRKFLRDFSKWREPQDCDEEEINKFPPSIIDKIKEFKTSVPRKGIIDLIHKEGLYLISDSMGYDFIYLGYVVSAGYKDEDYEVKFRGKLHEPNEDEKEDVLNAAKEFMDSTGYDFAEWSLENDFGLHLFTRYS